MKTCWFFQLLFSFCFFLVFASFCFFSCYILQFCLREMNFIRIRILSFLFDFVYLHISVEVNWFSVPSLAMVFHAFLYFPVTFPDLDFKVSVCHSPLLHSLNSTVESFLRHLKRPDLGIPVKFSKGLESIFSNLLQIFTIWLLLPEKHFLKIKRNISISFIAQLSHILWLFKVLGIVLKFLLYKFLWFSGTSTFR